MSVHRSGCIEVELEPAFAIRVQGRDDVQRGRHSPECSGDEAGREGSHRPDPSTALAVFKPPAEHGDEDEEGQGCRDQEDQGDELPVSLTLVTEVGQDLRVRVAALHRVAQDQERATQSTANGSAARRPPLEPRRVRGSPALAGKKYPAYLEPVRVRGGGCVRTLASAV